MHVRVPEGCELKKVTDLREGDQLVERDGTILTIQSVRDTANRTVFGVTSAKRPFEYLSLSRRKQVCVRSRGRQSPPEMTRSVQAKHVSVVSLHWPKSGYVVRRNDENFRLIPSSPDIEIETRVFDCSDEACDAAREAFPDAVIDTLG